jgi:hypothetical protein
VRLPQSPRDSFSDDLEPRRDRQLNNIRERCELFESDVIARGEQDGRGLFLGNKPGHCRAIEGWQREDLLVFDRC